MKRRFVVAVTGASGVTYAVRLVDVLLAAGCDVHLTISAAAKSVFKQELDLTVDLDKFSPSMLLLGTAASRTDPKLQHVRQLAGISSESSNVLSVATGEPGQVHYHYYRDDQAPIASGSFLTHGMVICPCSCGTLSAIVHGAATNLIHRAAEVHLKERRTLIVVPRETPLSIVQLRNFTRAAEAGVVVLPAMPGFYHGVTSIQDLIDFIVGRVCDHLGVEHGLVRRWGS
jgi:4-hydroxy-3-polyprenylbenzoate decarboxylase